VFDLTDIRRQHRKALREHHQAVRDAYAAAGKAADTNVKTKSVFKRRSSSRSLKDATRSRVIRGPKGAIIRLTWPKKYASFIDKGTSPHPITIRRAPYLRFYWPRVGHWVRFLRVQHPGTRPYHFGKHARHAASVGFAEKMKFGMRRVSSRFNYR
jgi:hypothetical protein